MKLKLFVLALLSLTSVALAAKQEGELSQELESLSIPSNMAPSGVEKEKLYSVQTRYSRLARRPEVIAEMGYNLSNNSFLNSYQGGVGLRYHISNRFNVGVAHTWVGNQFSSDTMHLISDKGVLPDVPYAISKTEGDVAYNVFYGKFRFGMDRVSYFDQYISLGGARIQMNNSTESAIVADAGFAFWMGTWGSLRVGLKDYYYKETSLTGRSAYAHNVHGHVGMGYLF